MTTEETRQVFEQLLKEKKSQGKNTKKKTISKKENEIVESLERSLIKDDPLLDSNTFDGEAEKNLKNLRNSGAIIGKENKESELRISVTKNLHQKRMQRKRANSITNASRSVRPSAGNISTRMKGEYYKSSSFRNQHKENYRNHEVENSVTQESTETATSDNYAETPHSSENTYNLSDISKKVVKNVKDKLCNTNLQESKDSVLKCLKDLKTSMLLKHNSSDLEENAEIPKSFDISDNTDMLTSKRSISVVVDNVNNLSNVFDSIWKQHSDTLIKERMKSELEDSFGKVLKHRSSPLLQRSVHPKIHAKRRTKSDMTVKAKATQISHKSNHGIGKDMTSKSMSFELEGSDSESEIYKKVWQRLSEDIFDARKNETPKSETGSFITKWQRSSGSEQSLSSENDKVTLGNSFKSVERILLKHEAEDQGSEMKTSAFWSEFWKKNGVKINLDEGKGEQRLIEDVEKSENKKPVRAKRKKIKKKEETLAENNEELLYATVQKTTKKTRRNLDEPPAYEEAESIPVPTPRKPKRTKSPEQLIEERVVQEEQETVPKTVERRKKRTKKRGTQRALPSANVSQTEEIEPEASPTDDAIPEIVVEPPTEEPSVVEDDGTILGVTIHHSDHIKVDPKYIAHPLVKVSIVDAFTGKFFSKFDSSRQVSSFYENESVSCIVPLMTQPYDFKANRSLLPRWEELLIFNEPFMRITKHNTAAGAAKPVLFFVIRDFVTMATANNKRSANDKGWHNVAWAFLMLVNSNGKPNAGRKMRLQLFYPPRTRGALQDPNCESAYDWWVNHPRQRYPATLYVTVKPIVSPSDIATSSRSMFATQPETGQHSFNDLNRSLEQADSDSRSLALEDDLAAMKLWSRLPGQTCKIPNSPLLRFWAGSEGSFTLQFSHRGTRLAAACRHETTYPILLYGIPNGEEIGIITGHQQLVYDLQWSKNDRYLLSASADGTAQVWDMDRREKPVHTLPHPCYVYTAAFHPVAHYIIATGGYDSIVRVWNIASVTSQLVQELDGHKAIINSIIFDKTGLNMYSADGSGVIICWKSPAQEKAKKNYKTEWSINNKIENRDLAGVCINSLKLHPHNNKILIHCRDSTVRILDARIHSMKKFIGLLNHRQLLRSSVTPCGSFIFSGSEDGCVYVWNADTGDQVAIYNELGYTSAVHTVVYHPHDHIVAFCSFAPNQSILLYKFNSAVATMEAGFKPEALESSFQTVPKKTETELSINAQVEASKSAVKLDRIKNQLDSVLSVAVSSLPPVPRGRDAQMTSRRSQATGFDPMSTWGSTFDSTTQIGSVLEPSYLSPHASPDARAMAQQYVRSGRPDPSGTWRPGVSSVGGSPYRNQGAGIPPDVTFTTDKDGKQKLNISSTPGTQSQSVVVVLFDYQANRSDELTIVRGDIIKVLYKDSENWWFGEKSTNGVQGYFPSSYVEEQVATSQIQPTDAPTPRFGVPETSKDKKVYALKMPGGRLNFYSQSESEGDDERLSNASMSSRQRRREAKFKDKIGRTNTPSPMTVLDETLQPTPSVGQPKSILHSPRSKPSGVSSSTENVKEVSFADDKNDKNPKAKQKLIESIQAAISKSEATAEPSKELSPTPSPRQTRDLKPKPSPSTRKKIKSVATTPTHAETSFNEEFIPKPKPTPAARLGILKTVQALMNKDDDSAFSQSVLGGHDLGTPKSQMQATGAFRPNVHSTAIKKPRDPVENDEDPLSPPSAAGSVIRKARPLPRIGKMKDEEAIPMMKLDSKTGRASPVGLVNPAFDTTP